MHPVLKHLLDTEFADLRGSRVEGRIALSDEIINLGLHDLLERLRRPQPPTPPAPAPTSGGAKPQVSQKAALPDPSTLLRHVEVDKLVYRTEQGRTVVEIVAGLPPTGEHST